MTTTPMTTHLRDLVHDPRNARQHTPRNIGMIAESLQKYGPARSIAIDEENVILAGNGVVEAAAQIGVEHVRVYDRATGQLDPEPPNGEPYIFAVRVSGLTPEQKIEYAIADNRTTDLSTFDPEVLASFAEDGIDLGQFWFDHELHNLMERAADDMLDFDPAAEWEGMPEYESEDQRSAKQIIVHFASEDDLKRFARLVEQNVTMATKSIWYPARARENLLDLGYVGEDDGDANE